MHTPDTFLIVTLAILFYVYLLHKAYVDPQEGRFRDLRVFYSAVLFVGMWIGGIPVYLSALLAWGLFYMYDK